jgi:hypothetical protein
MNLHWKPAKNYPHSDIQTHTFQDENVIAKQIWSTSVLMVCIQSHHQTKPALLNVSWLKQGPSYLLMHSVIDIKKN